MKSPRNVLFGFALIGFFLFLEAGPAASVAVGRPREVPPALKPWEDWATWEDRHLGCPALCNDAKTRFCFWPTRLSLAAGAKEASWQMEISCFDQGWVPLPGSESIWPREVRTIALGGPDRQADPPEPGQDRPVVVVARDRVPSVRLPVGRHRLAGAFRWNEIPQRIAIPRQVGLLSLTIGEEAVRRPSWDADGNLWLERRTAEAADEQALSAKVYRMIEDGIPMRLHTQIELAVSGKSREERLGWILPEGWLLAEVESPIPVAIDGQGRMKAQVRSGRWTVRAEAFRTTDLDKFQFPADADPIADRELIGFQADGAFRMAQLEGLEAVDAAQTTFPAEWRNLPVYQWRTGAPFRLTEKMRGMGERRPGGLAIKRQLWLDEDGKGLTWRDQIEGQMQRTWRLDAAEGQQLGAIRSGDQGQLITVQPETGAHGVEIRDRNLRLEAIGRTGQTRALAATGWRSDVDHLEMTLALPPGWRLLALFGADRVDGDWLTAWSLLDLFLLLIFALAVGRLWGWSAGIVALVAFGLSYHEWGAPRLTWLFLLIPAALLRVVPEGSVRSWIVGWKRLAMVLLALFLVPFVARQIEGAIYPQLERPGVRYGPRGGFLGSPQRRARIDRPQREGAGKMAAKAPAELSAMTGAAYGRPELQKSGARKSADLLQQAADRYYASNLVQDPKARIQTGPAEPKWSWNQVRCGWNGPVSADQKIRPIFINLGQHRLLTIARLALLLLLSAILAGGRTGWRGRARANAAAVLLLGCLSSGSLMAQIPDQTMLDQLRQRLLEPDDALPNAAEISRLRIPLATGRMVMSAEMHTVLETAVPLPGRFPVWSPISVAVDGSSAAALRRRDGLLWVVLPAGVHQVEVEGMLADSTQWELAFPLVPRQVEVDAPDWRVTGIRPDGSVGRQLFFSRRQQAAAGEASYDKRHFRPIVAVDRRLEIGLVWQVRTEVTRLSAAGKAVSLELPLLAGERVLTAGLRALEGRIDVRLDPQETSLSWESQLPIGNPIHLTAPASDRWVERWHLAASPVWSARLAGLQPVFEPGHQRLIPTWRPWPGEEATFSFEKPEAVAGETMTVKHVRHQTSLGSRQRTTELALDLECSLGADFTLNLEPDAELTALERDGHPLPVRFDQGRLTIPIHPGSQAIRAAWRQDQGLRTVAGVGPVSLPVDGANITTLLRVPESRWILWARGPRRGPAVRFWTILALALLAACVLAFLPRSPLRLVEWVLLAIGLTQVYVTAALLVVGWFFLFAWRGNWEPDSARRWRFNLTQLFLILVTLLMLVILVAAVGAGLLGDPEMYIRGNSSTPAALQWFQPRAGTELPTPAVVSVSVWFYRLLMLLWALWLAAALIGWLGWGWCQWTHGAAWLRKAAKAQPPPVEDNS